jgi:hypothetical protein
MLILPKKRNRDKLFPAGTMELSKRRPAQPHRPFQHRRVFSMAIAAKMVTGSSCGSPLLKVAAAATYACGRTLHIGQRCCGLGIGVAPGYLI